MIHQFLPDLVDLERSTLLASRMTAGSSPTDLRRAATSLMSRINRIRDCDSVAGEHHVELGSAYNWGSLLLFRAGKIKYAEDIACHLISLSVELHNLNRENIEWIQCAIQPYINIARINASLGHKSVAQRMLNDLYEWSKGRAQLILEPSGTLVRHQLSQHLDPHTMTVIRNCYVWDTVRTLFISRDYDDVLAFVDQMEEIYSDARPYSEKALLGLMISETTVRALIGVGDLRHAVGRAKTFLKDPQLGVEHNPAILGLIPHIDYVLGRSDVGRKNLDSVIEYCRKFDKLMANSHSWYWLALQDLLYGDYERAYSVAMQAADVSARNGHEAMEVKLRIVALMACMRVQSSNSVTDHLECWARLQAVVSRSLWAFERALGSVILGLCGSPDSSCSRAELYGYFSYGLRQVCDLGLAVGDHLESSLKRIAASVVEDVGVAGLSRDFGHSDTECMDRLYSSLLSLDVDQVKCWTG